MKLLKELIELTNHISKVGYVCMELIIVAVALHYFGEIGTSKGFYFDITLNFILGFITISWIYIWTKKFFNAVNGEDIFEVV